ncbi:ABC transporter ATP-binding protein [Haloarcula argentinensis]|uniref:ABC transporter ATP-binding protein n=1 Tax=Haloarcula argentinensis TaxID=43776 RepID=A0A830FKY0_HALAR|nr:ABC transporter ATP-binding protein [Haloarcula argentinensis]EMA17961.1 ABC transporter-like protein [Haloarcula argentinensis DSM 12282]MDS0255586.1 ABC transporter ATP-binding protein [Haloarcula argentinensis]GGM47809.1 ABC transporter ATP-binding protein [Haloarcula argentinensis]
MPPAVLAESISKRYDDTVALDDVSINVDGGEIFALVGPNGAGKTTLVEALTGTATPDSGSVSIFGESPTSVEDGRLGLLPQSFTPPERLTARELVTYYQGLYDDPQRVDDVLTAVGMETADETWYRNLSGGQQRRVCVGIALVNDPDLLFLDEPTTGIDPAGRQSLWSLIDDLAAGGTTIFLTTHYMKEAQHLADRVALLDDGTLVEVGPPTDLIESYGGGTHLLVETETSPEQLAGLDAEVESTEDGIRILDVATADIGRVVGQLDAQGVTYETLTWTDPSLEDVYLSLTDERIHEDGPSREPVTAGGRSQ